MTLIEQMTPMKTEVIVHIAIVKHIILRVIPKIDLLPVLFQPLVDISFK